MPVHKARIHVVYGFMAEGRMRIRWLYLFAVVLITAIACSSPPDETPTPTVDSSSPTPDTTPTVEVQPTATSLPASRWESIAPMNVGRTSYSATLLKDGRVMVVGGLGSEGVLRSVEIYDPESDTWTLTRDTIHPRRDSVLETLSDGRVVVAGGLDLGTVSTAEIFNPETETWTELPSMNIGREAAMAVALGDGRLLVFGGGNGVTGGESSQFEVRSAEIFDPELNEWKLIDPIAQAEMSWEGWVKLGDGRILLAGGDFARPNRFVQVFDPATDSWTVESGLDGPIGGGAAVLLPNGDVLLSGGGFRCCLTGSLVYDTDSGEWSSGPEMLVKRGGHIGFNLPDGRIVFLFGLNPDFPFDPLYRSGEILDPETGERELLADYPGIFDIANDVVVLENGTVFQGGGRQAVINADGSIDVAYSTDAFLLIPPEKG